jgi:UDP-N-acetylmuramate: L-alanyl-gamma-D-glutamyl-meso-diaminopimelate ligase
MIVRSGAHIHFIAACGTAMASLAALLKQCGYRITGSDQDVYPPMSEYLRRQGIEIESGFSAERLLPPPDLVVVGNAVSRGNPEVEATLDNRVPYVSLPEALREFFLRDKRPIVVSGTHGKTTTTALTAHILTSSGLDPSFLIAGLPRQTQQPANLGEGDYFVVEGDEYDSAFFAKFPKFLYYMPEILILTGIEYDHADIYADISEIERAFAQLINTVPGNGLLLAAAGDTRVAELSLKSFAPVQSFGLSANAFWRAIDIVPSPGSTSFSILRENEPQGRFELPLNGTYNVSNALAAVGAAAAAGASMEAIRDAIASFAGVSRRQEVLGTVDGVTLMDDFAHHPTAVAETLGGVREAYPDRRLWAVFEPASATNARALFEDRYTEAFAVADRVVMTKVPRPERARDDPPMDAVRLVEALTRRGITAVYLPEPDQVVAHLVTKVDPGDLVIFMSNGGFGGIQRRTLRSLKERFEVARK